MKHISFLFQAKRTKEARKENNNTRDILKQVVENKCCKNYNRLKKKDEQTRRFETHDFNCSFPHLKTIKILNFSRSVMPLVKYLLKHATVLEKFIIAARRKRSDVSPNYVKMEQELLSFPRSSSQVSVIFSY